MNKLEASYDKQKAIFDEAKSRKMANIFKQMEEINQKVERLREHYDELTIAYDTKREEEFIPYPKYQATAIVQSCVSKETNDPDLSHLDEETKAIVLEELAKRDL